MSPEQEQEHYNQPHDQAAARLVKPPTSLPRCHGATRDATSCLLGCRG